MADPLFVTMNERKCFPQAEEDHDSGTESDEDVEGTNAYGTGMERSLSLSFVQLSLSLSQLIHVIRNNEFRRGVH